MLVISISLPNFQIHYIKTRIYSITQKNKKTMKKIKILFTASFLLLATVMFGQAEKTVSPIKAGTKLTDSDIGFLSLVAKTDLSANRGAATRAASINKVSYSAGKTLSAADAKSINTAIKAFQKGYKTPSASRGDLCYYWYYYCDGYGYCYYYKVYYYC